jgi:predicted O-methyltransferase YrrM
MVGNYLKTLKNIAHPDYLWDTLTHPADMLMKVPSIMRNLELYSLKDGIDGILSWNTGLSLFQAVIESHHNSPNVVEIGSYQGLSTTYLAYASKKKGKRVKSFDWFQGLTEINPELDKFFIQKNVVSDKDIFDSNLKKRGLRDIVDLTVGDARLTLLPIIKENGFCVAFIDVDIYDVTLNLLNQLKSVIHGGETIIVHDYQSTGIAKATGEFMKSFDKEINYSIIKDRQCPAIKIKIL